MPSSHRASSSSSDNDDSDDDTAAVAATVTALNTSLSAFERTHIAPLLAEPSLKDLLARYGDGADVDKAKLLVTLAYVIEDLVWIYLRTKGLDPAAHAVVPELQRVKAYFTKIQEAVDPPKRTMVVDRPAAARFIRSALNAPRGEDANDIGMQTRFNILKHQEAALRGAAPSDAGEASGSGSSDDDDDEVAEGASVVPPAPPAGRAKRSKSTKGKGKERASAAAAAGADGSSAAESDVVVVDAGALEKAAGSAAGRGAAGVAGEKRAAGGGGGKGKRAKVDPFAGYDSPASATSSPRGGARKRGGGARARA